MLVSRFALRSVATGLLLLLAACGDDASPPTGTDARSDGPDDSTAAEAPAMTPLTTESIDAYRERIKPTRAELAWEQIDWQTSYAAGLRAAAAQDKPLLLWVMNGNPLGCT